MISESFLFQKFSFIAESAVIRYCAAQCLSNIARIDGFLRSVLQNSIAPLQKKLRSGETRTNSRCGLVELLFVLSGLHVEVKLFYHRSYTEVYLMYCFNYMYKSSNACHSDAGWSSIDGSVVSSSHDR